MKPDQLLTDETFLAWYFRTDEVSIKKWEDVLREEPNLKAAAEEAVYLLQLMQSEEESMVGELQTDDAAARLMAEVRSREEALHSRRWLQSGLSGRYTGNRTTLYTWPRVKCWN
jgi:hypothetical protein